MKAFAVALALSQGVVASAAPSFQATTFLLAPSQLGAVATTAGTHYGDPCSSAGCESDEQPVSVTGIDGSFCSPDCTTAACPTDVPAGATATPQCALTAPSGAKGCALMCSPSATIKDQKVADAACGAGASCKPIQGTGICTYDDCGPPFPAPTPPPPPPTPPTPPTPVYCTGSSWNLAQDQCDAWVKLWDNTKGPWFDAGWEGGTPLCEQKGRTDPCGGCPGHFLNGIGCNEANTSITRV